MATQAHRGPRSQGSDHSSKSHCTSTEQRARVRHLPLHSDSTKKGMHHIVKRPDQAGLRVPARAHHTSTQHGAPTATQQQLAPMWRWSGESLQEVGCQPWQLAHPTTSATTHTPTHPRTPRTSQHPPPGYTSTSPPFNIRHPPHHPTPTTTRGPTITAPRRNRPRTPNNRHNPYPCAPCGGKGTQHARQGHKGEGRGFVLRSPKGGLCAGIWRQEVVMSPVVREKTPQVDILGPTGRRWGEVPHCRLGMATWTHLANGKGSCLPRALDTEK